MKHGFVTIAGDLSLRSSPAHGLHEVAYVHKYADDSYTLRIRSHVKMPELPYDFVERMFLSGSATGSPAALLKSLW